MILNSPHSRRRLGRASLGLALLAVLGSWSGGVAAQTKSECVAAYKDGQVRRKDGELIAARKSFEVCASAACSPVLRRDCGPWLAQVKEAIPTIAVHLSVSGGDALSTPRVLLDGAVAFSAWEGKLELDPGAHVVRAEAEGYLPEEQSVKVRAGERSVPVDLVLSPVRGERAGPIPATRPIPASSIVFGAIGLAGVGAFVGFGLWGNEQRAGLESCKPACDPARVDEVKRDYVIADVSLGVGVASIGLATLFFLTRPVVLSPAVSSLQVQVGRERAGLWLSGSF